MVLYDSPVSGNCYKVRLLLAKLGLEVERITVSVSDRSNRPELLGDLNPALRVPTIVLDDGRSLGESGAIMWWFGEGTELVPDDRFERSQMLQWMFFEQYDHEPNLAVARFWLHVLGGAPEGQSLEAKQEGARKAIGAMESHLHGRTYLVAERFTIAFTSGVSFPSGAAAFSASTETWWISRTTVSTVSSSRRRTPRRYSFLTLAWMSCASFVASHVNVAMSTGDPI